MCSCLYIHELPDVVTLYLYKMLLYHIATRVMCCAALLSSLRSSGHHAPVSFDGEEKEVLLTDSSRAVHKVTSSHMPFEVEEIDSPRLEDGLRMRRRSFMGIY